MLHRAGSQNILRVPLNLAVRPRDVTARHGGCRGCPQLWSPELMPHSPHNTRRSRQGVSHALTAGVIDSVARRAQALPSLMPGFDKEIARLAQRVLINPRNIDYHTNVLATKVTPGAPVRFYMKQL